MVTAITIRVCEPGDLPAVSQLLSDTWHATYDAIYGVERVDEITSRWHCVDALAANLTLADSVFLVAVRGERVVGTSFARFEADAALIRCDRIYVHPDAQGTGIGYGLLGEMIVRSGPADRICLEVEPDNKPAIAFYERAGFRVTGRGNDCGGQGDGIAHLTMERVL